MNGSPFFRLVREALAAPVPLGIAGASLLAAGCGQLALTWVAKSWLEQPAAGWAGATGPLLLRASGLTLLLAAAVFVSRLSLAFVKEKLLFRLRRAAFDRLVAVPAATARRLETGDVLARTLQDSAVVGDFVETVLKRVVGDGLVAAGAIVLMVTISWRLALAASVLVPAVGALLAGLGRIIRLHGTAARQEAGRLSAVLLEQLRGLTTVKGYQAEAFERERFAAQSDRVRRAALRTEAWSAFLLVTVFAATGVALLAGIGWGSAAARRGEMALPELLAFCLYAAQTVEPLRRLADVHGTLQRALAAADRVFELIDLGPIEREAGRRLTGPRGELRLESLRFRYRDDAPVLEGVDLSIRAGEAVAIVAASGGGKSTLAGLLVRHVEPTGGRLLLDGIDLRELSLGDLRRAVCVVEQEPFLFSGPLGENIRYGSWGAPRGAIEEAARMAGLEEVLRTLPRGLDEPLAEGGRDLSGGQRQRVALARAIVRDPALLVLDEATGALDGETEARVLEGMAGWLSRRTVLTFAHRLSTVNRFPRVVVLDGGRVVGDGTAADLLRSCPPFSALFAGQVESAAGLSVAEVPSA